MGEPDAVWRTLAAIRAAEPLVHNITNIVVTNSTANALLAVGASPAMAESPDEVEELVGAAAALVVNLGTVSGHWPAAMRLATARAAATATPWVLDPVAVGALSYRSAVAAELLRHRPQVVRGNASEILALSGSADAAGRGVDSRHRPEDALDAAKELASTVGCVVAVTGQVDYVTDGARLSTVHNGHPMMTRVTGLGCTATALIGACLAVEPDPFAAALHGLALLGVAGELAAAGSAGPGSLQTDLLNRLYHLDRDCLLAHGRMQ